MAEKYWVNNIVQDGKQNPEPIARYFLLQNADTLRLTRHSWKEFGFFRFKKFGDDKDLNVIRVLNTLKELFRKKIKSNIADSGGKTKEYEYYFYDLKDNLIKILEKETIVWSAAPPLPSRRLYGFENPAFYQKNKIIGEVISRAGEIFLYLSENERKKLEKEGLELRKV